MITAKHNTFYSWFFLLFIVAFLILLASGVLNKLFLSAFAHTLKMDNKIFIVAYVFIGIIILFSLIFVSTLIKQINVDPIAQVVIIRNIITRQTRQYDFSYFDGMIEISLAHKSVHSKTIGLIKDNRMVHYIDSFWVSNYAEIKEALKKINYLGTFNYGFLTQIKFLLRLPFFNEH